MIKINRRKEILIAIVFFLLGSLATFLYKEKEISIKGKQTGELTKACMIVTGINRQLYNNCKASVDEVLSCYANSSCDINASIIRYGKIIKENEQLEKELDKTANDLVNKVDSIK